MTDAIEARHEAARSAVVLSAGALVDAIVCVDAGGPSSVARAFTALRAAVVDERAAERELGVALAQLVRGAPA